MAMSVNGMIATETGDEDFLSQENWDKFRELTKEFGNFIIGRKTYEAVKGWQSGNSFDEIKAEKIVISRDISFIPDHGYISARSPEDALKRLEEKGFKRALITGGSTTNTLFAKQKLIDEIILNVEPVFIGQGIPLFSFGQFDLPVKLASLKETGGGIITLRYTVQK